MNRVLIKNAIILTMGERDVIENGYVYIEENKIKEVNEGEYNGDLDGVYVIDAKGGIVMPGFVNAHTHIPMTLLRGYGEGLPLMKWLREKVWPFENKLTQDDVEIGSHLGLIEMIKSGTTSFIDMYFHEMNIADVVERVKVRGFLAHTIIGENHEEQFKYVDDMYNRFKDSKYVNVLIGPHSPYTLEKEILKQVGDYARYRKIPIHIHLSETLDEIEIIKEKYNMTPIELCESIGLFDSTKTIAAHCVHLYENDFIILRNKDITAVHNPQSNMKLASGIAPVTKMIEHNINVALGTDGTSSNNNLDMFDEMRSASLLQKLSNMDATALSSYNTIKMATLNGYTGLGVDDEIGKIEENYKADMIIIDTNNAHMLPMHDVYSNIVFSANGNDVKTVIVDGNIVMENYELKTIDEEYYLYEANKRVKDIISR